MSSSTRRVDQASPVRRSTTGRGALPAARLAYAGASAGSLFLAVAFGSSLETIGRYTYLSALGAAIAAALTLGADRVVSRRLAERRLSRPVYPMAIARLRAYECLVVVLSAIVVAALRPGLALAVVSVAGWVITRLIYNDVESFAIATRASESRLARAIGLNAAVTSVGTVVGSLVTAEVMVLGSAMGNIVGLVPLVVGTGLRIQDVPELRTGLTTETWPVGLSVVLALAYGRADLLILHSLEFTLAEVGIYGLCFRIVDSFVLVRGSLAQQEVREVASMEPQRRWSRILRGGTRLTVVVAVMATTGALTVTAFPTTVTWLLPAPVSCAVAGAIVLATAHYPTAIAVYSDRRTRRLLAGSAFAAVASLSLKWVLAYAAGLDGMILGLGIVEVVSFLTFVLAYRLWTHHAVQIGRFLALVMAGATPALLLGIAA